MPSFAPKRILIPVCGYSTDEEAVSLGCRISKRESAKVRVITVLEVDRSRHLGETKEEDLEKAEKVLAAAEEIGHRLEVNMETEILQAREAAPAILEETKSWSADLLVFGLPWRTQFGEFHLGKSAPFILRMVECRTILVREPANAK